MRKILRLLAVLLLAGRAAAAQEAGPGEIVLHWTPIENLPRIEVQGLSAPDGAGRWSYYGEWIYFTTTPGTWKHYVEKKSSLRAVALLAARLDPSVRMLRLDDPAQVEKLLRWMVARHPAALGGAPADERRDLALLSRRLAGMEIKGWPVHFELFAPSSQSRKSAVPGLTVALTEYVREHRVQAVWIDASEILIADPKVLRTFVSRGEVLKQYEPRLRALEAESRTWRTEAELQVEQRELERLLPSGRTYDLMSYDRALQKDVAKRADKGASPELAERLRRYQEDVGNWGRLDMMRENIGLIRQRWGYRFHVPRTYRVVKTPFEDLWNGLKRLRGQANIAPRATVQETAAKEAGSAGRFALAYVASEGLLGAASGDSRRLGTAVTDMGTQEFWRSLAVFTVASKGVDKTLELKRVAGHLPGRKLTSARLIVPMAAGMAAASAAEGRFDPVQLGIGTAAYAGSGAAADQAVSRWILRALPKAGMAGRIASNVVAVSTLTATLAGGQSIEGAVSAALR